jgi:hypothetical protein
MQTIMGEGLDEIGKHPAKIRLNWCRS